jgi:hypothetical protein
MSTELVTANETAMEVHASDCAYWCLAPCDCSARFDADDLLDREKDEELGL